MRHSFAPTRAAFGSLLTVIALVALSHPLEGQHRPENGDWSVGIALFDTDTGTQFGIGRQFGERWNVAFEATWRRADAEDRAETIPGTVDAAAEAGEWLVGPTVRFFGAQDGPVVPFLRSRVAFGNAISNLDVAGVQLRDQDTFTVSASLAIGAEWFPVDGIGLSGHTGIQWSRETLDRLNEDDELFQRETNNIGTFRSAITMSFYFQ